MTEPNVTMDVQDHVAHIGLHRQEHAGALTPQMLDELDRVLAELAELPQLDACVLRSHHPRAFSPGLDVEALSRLNPDDLRRMLQLQETILYRLENLPVPTIALVTGPALGGGLSLAVACDIRLGDHRAAFGMPMARLGLMQSANLLLQLVTLIGPSRTKELVYRGKTIDADTAYRWGLLNEVAEAGRLEQSLTAWLDDIRGGAPTAMRAGKRSVDLCVPMTMSRYVPTAPYFVDPQEFHEGLAAFLEGRPPNWKKAPLTLSPPR